MRNIRGDRRILVYHYVIAYALLCLVVFFPEKLYSFVVGEIEVKGLHSIGREELLHLLAIRPGSTIDAEIVRTGIKRAFLKGIFEDISVETTGEDTVKVAIHVTEHDLVEKIRIRGDMEISKKTLKKLLILHEEQFLMCNMLDRAITDLKQKLALRGYPQAQVTAEIEKLSEPYRVAVDLLVNTGTPEIIRSIKISGAADEIKDAMKLGEGDVYDQTVLKANFGRIKSYLRDQDYVSPSVEKHTFSDGVLSLFINPGKKLQISLEGNESISDRKLMKEMPFFDVEDFNDDIVQEAVQRMITLYYANGYPLVQIAPVITKQDDTNFIKFFVYEGPVVRVSDISFSGSSFPEEKLKEIISLKAGKKYNPDLLESDRSLLGNFYNALGYLSVSIDDFETTFDDETQRVKIAVKIHEGAKTLIGAIAVSGARLIPEPEVRNVIKIKNGDPYNEVDIADARFRIIELYSNSGFPDVKVAVQRTLEGQKASLSFMITEGTRVVFGKTIVTGNMRTNYRVIDRELQKKEDLPFDYRLLTQERQKLYKLGLFTDVELRTIDESAQKRDVLVKLRESEAGAVEVGLGYTDYEQLRGFLDVNYRNLWGMNRQASLRLELSTIEKRYVLQYYEPWFLQRPMPFRAILLGEDKEEIDIDTREVRYRLTRHTATAGFDIKLSTHMKSELYYEFSLVNTYDVEPDVVLSKEDTGTLIISGLRLGIIYDTRDHPFYPSRGILSGISAKITAPVFFSETDFVKVMLHFNLYQKVYRGVVLAASLRGGFAEGYRDTRELPIVERFFLGGRTTVRGYEQDTLGPVGSDGNPTGGNAFLMESLELRTSITDSIGFVVFLDGGNVWVKLDEIDPSDLKFTAGIGLRYNTPVGPVRVDYGRKLQQEKGESSGEIHFSIGHAF